MKAKYRSPGFKARYLLYILIALAIIVGFFAAPSFLMQLGVGRELIYLGGIALELALLAWVLGLWRRRR